MSHHDPNEIYPVPEGRAETALINAERYTQMYRRSLEDPDGFWREEARRIDWMTPFTEISDVSWDKDDLHIRWFADGKLNASVNCIDRHLAERADETAILWEGDDPADDKAITYRQLHEAVCRLANGLKSIGVQKGDRVTIYMPMIPEAAYAMLACARIGAVHSVVFGGFSPDALAGRISDCESLGRDPRCRLRHAGRGTGCELRSGTDERRGSALHPLHVRINGKTQGRAAHDRRLHGLGVDDA
jgi:acetyl-CoA synthetase